MSSSELLMEIKEILMEVMEVEECDYDKYKINRETYLVNKVGVEQINLSSLDFVRFIVEIENKYGVFYDFEEDLTTVGNVIDYISKYKKWRKSDE